jgi:hypothetical protein
MEILLDPPRAAGPFVIGMPVSDAVEMLRTVEGYREPRLGACMNPYLAHYESGLSISLGPDARGLLHAVELYYPERDVTVLFGDIAVFDLPADEVIRLLRAVTPIEVDHGGSTVIAPALLLAFGNPMERDNADGLFFESVLLAAPGYYDGPADVPQPQPAPVITDENQLPLFQIDP